MTTASLTLKKQANGNGSRPTVIDLFAGAGGFGLGFQMAGFTVPLSLEMDAWACDTLRHNHPQMTILEQDIRDTPERITELCPFLPDVIIGGPPCQGFSVAGPAKKDPTDPRNSLFTYFAEWVKKLAPKAFVMENVKGLLNRRNAQGEPVIRIIERTFTSLGYRVEIWTLNAARYGVPQIRERIFVVGHQGNSEIYPPAPTHALTRTATNVQFPLLESREPAVSLWEAISDLPELEAGQGDEEQNYPVEAQTPYQFWARQTSDVLYNHAAMHHSKRLVERFKHIEWGMSSAQVPDQHGARLRNGNGTLSGAAYDQNNRRLHPYKPSHTIAASFYANFVHPFQHRNLTAREGARVQSFPDHYRFKGKKTVVSHRLLQREQRFDEKYLCQYNQIGNAVPPLLAKAVAAHLGQLLGLCRTQDQS